MTTAYDLSFRNPMKPYMARGDFMFGSIPVVVSPFVPKEHYADEIRYVSEWAVVRWLRSLVGSEQRPRAIKRGPKMEREQAFMVGDKMFVGPEGWRELQFQMKQPICKTGDFGP